MVDRDVLVVTHPLAPASESHVEALLDILDPITSVSLLTANLQSNSNIRKSYEVIDISHRGVGDSIVVAAVRFLINQLLLCWAIRQRREQIVLFFGATSYLLPIAFARLLGRTIILEPRGNVPLTLRLQWEKRIPSVFARGLAGCVWVLERAGYWLADGIITYTPAMANELGLSRFAEKLYQNGARYIDTETFYPRVPYEERDEVVGFIGRLDEEKNVRKLATVASNLPKSVTFRFIGDGYLRAELERELASEIESESVEFTGWVDHDAVPAQLSELRLLVLPSEPTEGLPTVILESMACGTPVLATPVSGVPDVVRDGETGFLISSSDTENMTQKIIEILEDESLRNTSNSGRTLILDQFDFDRAVERYRTVLQSLPH